MPRKLSYFVASLMFRLFSVFFFCRFSTVSRHEARKMIVKVSGIDLEQGNIQMIVIPAHFSLLFFPLPAELSYPRLRVLLQFDTQEFLNVLSMVSFFFFFRHSVEQCSVISSAIVFPPPISVQEYNLSCTISYLRLLSEKTSTIILSKSSSSSPSYLYVALH